MSDFKKLRNMFVYNGFDAKGAGDMSSITVMTGGGDEVIFEFGAGGDVLTDIHPYQDKDIATDDAYDDGYDDAKGEAAEEVDAAYEAGYDKGRAEGEGYPRA
ncbi:hypothetical protein DRO27_05230 [Candidatus Bathyarchaeota archaeon]|nr:MAG: hypothetical protein DRO27_05230 [Candidatus Bathyarchaeota archaeon]